jgi:hypothetical protein
MDGNLLFSADRYVQQMKNDFFSAHIVHSKQQDIKISFAKTLFIARETAARSQSASRIENPASNA